MLDFLPQILIAQVIAFLILLPVINRLLFKPVVKLLEEREEKTTGALKKAAEADAEVASGLALYEKKLKEAAVKGHEERNKLRAEAAVKEKAILEEARAKVATEFAAIRVELDKSKVEAVAKLKTEAKAFSTSIAEKILDRKVVALVFALILPLLPAIVMAATGHDAGGGESHGDSGMLWKVINFIILIAALAIVWFKFIRKMLDKRSVDIQKALDSAKEAKDIADRKAEEYRAKLAILDANVANVQNEIRLEGEAELKRIIAEAEVSAGKLREQAKFAAEQEIKKARIAIRAEVAELAATMAEEILKKELKDADQERIVKGYIDKLRLN